MEKREFIGKSITRAFSAPDDMLAIIDRFADDARRPFSQEVQIALEKHIMDVVAERHASRLVDAPVEYKAGE